MTGGVGFPSVLTEYDVSDRFEDGYSASIHCPQGDRYGEHDIDWELELATKEEWRRDP